MRVLNIESSPRGSRSAFIAVTDAYRKEVVGFISKKMILKL